MARTASRRRGVRGSRAVLLCAVALALWLGVLALRSSGRELAPTASAPPSLGGGSIEGAPTAPAPAPRSLSSTARAPARSTSSLSVSTYENRTFHVSTPEFFLDVTTPPLTIFNLELYGTFSEDGTQIVDSYLAGDLRIHEDINFVCQFPTWNCRPCNFGLDVCETLFVENGVWNVLPDGNHIVPIAPAGDDDDSAYSPADDDDATPAGDDDSAPDDDDSSAP